jgi:anaphase-promoting complex subunit 3
MQPDFAYAYTLSGHEYSANDDFEKAMACYRSAIRIDERHYNAWYGLGNIYYRQEKFDFAEHHLRKALQINPCSSPLFCYLGMALHANHKTLQALEMLSNAVAIDSKNPLARFQKAQVLISMDHYEAALHELRELVEVAPKEGSVGAAHAIRCVSACSYLAVHSRSTSFWVRSTRSSANCHTPW